MNRGSDFYGWSLLIEFGRFNEAPIHESGKFRRSVPIAGQRHCFNEAPIHESGKYGSRIIEVDTMLGFNEAPIHESGKSRRRSHAWPAWMASMRPRFMNRGSQVGDAQATMWTLLQ